jgi:transposase
MRGSDFDQSQLYSYLSPEDRVPGDHPLRAIRLICDEALRSLSRQFGQMYSPLGRSSVPPEKLLRALVLQILYTIRSERLLIEQLEYNLLFRWFVGLSMDEEVWVATTFTKNRERLLKGDIAKQFFLAVRGQAEARGLLSDEHFTVDGTLLEAWASMKSFQKKEEPPEKGSGTRGNVLLRDTHESTTDPDAKLFRKSAGGAFHLSHMAHLLMENRNHLAVAGQVTEATTSAEWEAAVEMLEATTQGQGGTVGADMGYDQQQFVEAARAVNITPHVTQLKHKRSNIDGRTTRHEGYQISLHKRRGIEQIFGWLKNVGLQRKVRHRGRASVSFGFQLALAAYNMVRLRNLAVQPA